MNETERQQRQLIWDLAWKWRGTRYVSNGMVMGPRGGIDCAMILVAVYKEAGYIPRDFDPRPYPPQWHVHRNEERYLGFIHKFSREFDGPPHMGDVVVFKITQSFAHGAIVGNWPQIIHARAPLGVLDEDVSRNTTGKRALWPLPKRYFTVFGT